MRGHIRKRCKCSNPGRCRHPYSIVVDEGRQMARRCGACGHRVWVFDYRLDTCPKCDGELGAVVQERRQRWETHRTRREAEAALGGYVAGVARGDDVFPRDLRVGEYLPRWLERHVERLRPQTARRYRHFIERWWVPELGQMHLDRVRVADVQRILDAMATGGLAPRSVVYGRAVISAAMSDAVRGELIPRNPVAGARTPKVEDPDLTVITPEQVLELLVAAESSPWRLPIVLAATTGARRSEVLGMKWSEINLEERTLAIRRGLQQHPKTKALEFLPLKTKRSRRTVRLTPGAVELLRAHRRKQTAHRLALGAAWNDLDLVCEDGIGGPLNPGSFSQATKRLMKGTGLPAHTRLHDLRHAVAVLLAVEGVPLVAVAEVLGHSRPSFTAEVYQHVVSEMQDAAADALERRLGAGTFADGLQKGSRGS